ncbi:hypothetical protein M9H77_18416 [Catharanthus roseus]|uniref:Uncharacterized protein n=1 Tax=Catharanthus roseus TaxID=4058 RepID=A0ACC0B7F9_CATRO|nr:hypothetical protein M9H77_18416 [Catharanthus roseus]
MTHHTRRWIYWEGVLVGGSSGRTSSSSYSLREIVPDREPIPIIDLSDSETVEGPAVQGMEPGLSIEEDSNEAESDVGMLPEQEGAAPAPVDAEGMDTLAEGGSPVPLSPICGYCIWSGQQLETARQQIAELREEIFRWTVPAPSWNPGQEVLVVDTLRRSRLGVGHSRPSNYADEAVSENSQSRQPEPTGENTPRPERAMYTVMENFMIRMTELLETSMATRRNERVPAIGTDEVLE